MATGYTADVKDGKITEFVPFAKLCARAMGAFVMMRDDAMDKPLPEAFPAGTYEKEALATAKAELARLEALTPEAAATESVADYERAMAAWRERRDERQLVKRRYESMLAKVRAWRTPSMEHERFKTFMVDQLTESICFDCSESFDDEPEKRTPSDWLAERIKREAHNVGYFMTKAREEQERTDSRNLWIKQLLDSLSAEPA